MRPPKQIHLFPLSRYALPPRPRTHQLGYASRPGSGPDKQRCNTCKFRQVVVSEGRRSSKCELVAVRWTPGRETDIKPGAPACADWIRKPYSNAA